MIAKLAIGAAPLVLGLVLLGLFIDSMESLQQTVLWVALQFASLGGAAVGLAAISPLAEDTRTRWRFILATAVAWRLAYFPIMVFSGHVASIGEWILQLSGLPIWVYPTFLLAVAALHGAAAALACAAVAAPWRWIRPAGVAAFVIAACVSLLSWRDLGPLPDTAWTIDESAIPPARTEGDNPYLPAITAPGYWPHQRVILIAAGLTYDTIPPSPWATTVKAVLEQLFLDLPHAATRDRVVEHYLGYHAAHPWIGCRSFEQCPIPTEGEALAP